MGLEDPAGGLSGKLPISPAKKIFGVGTLAIFTFSFLVNVNTTPQLATFGLGALLVFALAIFCFLAPQAMASTEMGTAWPRTGGVYVWTRIAFGEPAGFLVIWLEWANFVVAWPSIMGTLTVQAAAIVDPDLANNPVFLVLTVILVTWLAAGFALRGLRVASAFAWYSVVAGTLIPALILVGFAVYSLIDGQPPKMDVSWSGFTSAISMENIAFISGALLMFSGVEVAAIHAADIRNPGRTIPRANFIAVALTVVVLAPLTLAIAVLLPANDINIISGIVEAGQSVFEQYGVSWLLPIFGFLIVTGLAAALVQIINGPSRGLVVAGRQGGNIPPALQRENNNKMPVVIILGQAAISSVLALGYLFLGTVQNAWFMFALIQTNMTLIMYTLMFASVIKLRYLKPNQPRPYKIPGKRVGLFGFMGMGILVCIFGLLVSFTPTSEATGMSTGVYILVLAIGTIGFAVMPFLFWIFRKPSWQTEPTPGPDEPDPESVAVTTD